MSDEKPGLHIDLDWKKQAQEEKRKLEEAEKQRAEERAAQAQVPAAPAGVVPSGMAPEAVTAAGGKSAGRRGRGERELPPASVASLAQSLVTQALYYLGDMGTRGGDEMANMDMAKHLIDTLGVLEEKTANNLTPEEKTFLDQALYEARMRFIAVAGEVVAGV
jgi:hypothetical protein